MGMRARKVLAVTVVAGVVLAGCGKSGGASSSGSTGETAAVSAKTYVSKICGAMNTWQQAIKKRVDNLNASLSPTDTVDQRKQALATYLDNLVSDTGNLVQSAKAAGAPDVSGGETAANRIDTAFQQVENALQDARDKVDALPTNVTAFQNAVQQLSNDITDSTTKIGDSLNTLTQGDLDSAFNDNPTCQKIASFGG